ncbi:iron ABC transporter permease [Treponema maltophilum]
MPHKEFSVLFGLFLFVLPIIAMIISLSVGRYSVSASGTVRAIVQLLVNKSVVLAKDDVEAQIIIGIRLPRILLGLLCGCALATAGAGLQALLSNPLVSPDTLGIASGASFGAALALLLDQRLLIVQLSALAFGLAALYLTYQAGKMKRQHSMVMLVLAGVMVSALFQAMVSLIKYTADSEEKLPTITYWLLGSLNNATWKGLAVGAPIIFAGTLILILARWKCNVLTLSEDEAKSMGINLRKIRLLIIVASAAIIASSVSMCGQIGWVGLVVPHICRMLFGSDNRRVIPASTSIGAVFMLLLDTVARSATQSEIPLSILTAIVGAPFFIILLKRTGGGWN